MSAWCRSCQAQIEWARVAATGKAMPVDAGSAGDPAGTLAVWRDPASSALLCRVLPAGGQLRPGEHRGIAHWVTCPSADIHRRSQ